MKVPLFFKRNLFLCLCESILGLQTRRVYRISGTPFVLRWVAKQHGGGYVTFRRDDNV